jgi:hypothetical protein
VNLDALHSGRFAVDDGTLAIIDDADRGKPVVASNPFPS